MSLRILHTADWHIGQTFHGYDRSFEHEKFLNWLVSTLESYSIDVLLVSGDVFDIANPSANSQKIFFNFLNNAKNKVPNLQIIITAGNHDSASRLEAPKPLFENMNISVIGVVPRDRFYNIDYNALTVPLYNNKKEIEAWCMAVPFLRLGDYPPLDKETNDHNQGVLTLYDELFAFVKNKTKLDQGIIAMGHLHLQGAITTDDDKSERTIVGGMEFIPVESFNSEIAYLALGHIHKAQIVGDNPNFRYCGSPLPMSFSEIGYDHQVIILELEKNKVTNLMEIKIPVTVELVCIPEFHEPLPKVLAILEGLKEKTENFEDAPFVEIRVLIDGVETSLKHKFELILANKHVKFARINSKYKNEKAITKSNKLLSFDEFKRLDPIEIALTSYKAKFNSEMSSELNSIMTDIVNEALLSES